MGQETLRVTVPALPLMLPLTRCFNFLSLGFLFFRASWIRPLKWVVGRGFGVTMWGSCVGLGRRPKERSGRVWLASLALIPGSDVCSHLTLE